MGSLRRLNSFFDGFNRAYDLGNRLELDYRLRNAADVKPEAIKETSLTETTKGAEDMVYDTDTGQYLPRYIGADGQPTENAATQQGDVMGAEPVEGMRPTFDAKTTTRHKLGDRTQDMPFNDSQIAAERMRRQSGVYAGMGMADKAAQIGQLARSTEEQGTTDAIRAAGLEGFKNTKDLREGDKNFATTKAMYEQALRLGRPDLAQGYYTQMMTSREALLKSANGRADRRYRATGDIGGYVDAYNRYVADDQTIESYRRTPDGWEVSIKTGDGKTATGVVPAAKIDEYIMSLTDHDALVGIERKRAQTMFEARAKAQEKLSEPMKVGKDERVVIPGTEQEFGGRKPGAMADPKDNQAVYDDIRSHALQVAGQYDNASGKWTWTPDAEKLAGTMERLFASNPDVPVTMLRDIARSGKEVMQPQKNTATGKMRMAPHILFNGRLYPIGGMDTGAAPLPPVSTTDPRVPGGVMQRFDGLQNDFRDTRGQMQKQGMQRLPSSTPADFPRVSAADQQARDLEAGHILLKEAGSPERARTLIADMKQAMRDPKLDGTRRQVLKSYVARMELALADLDTGG